jgi:hypothetical protein
MSTTTSSGARPAAPAAAARALAKPARPRHTPGGAGLGKDAGPEARRLAAAILEVLAGVRTPSQAAEALGVSLPRYFQVETRALESLLAGCAPRPRGPQGSAESELTALRRQHERLQRELSRQQTLLRLAQRTLGLAPPKPSVSRPDGKGKSKKRRRKPVVRALRAAQQLQQRSQQTGSSEVRSQEASAAAATPEQQAEG